MHFFNPAPVMKLVEVIAGINTPDEVVEKIKAISKEIGKTPVQVKEAPGFVVNRILVPMINEAVVVLSEGTATAEDIDTAMQLGANHPMGPLALVRPDRQRYCAGCYGSPLFGNRRSEIPSCSSAP